MPNENDDNGYRYDREPFDPVNADTSKYLLNIIRSIITVYSLHI